MLKQNKSNWAQETVYIRDEAGQVLAEFDRDIVANGVQWNFRRYNYYLFGKMVSAEGLLDDNDNNGIYEWGKRYYFHDHLGSIRGIIDGQGHYLQAIEYWPYGEELTSATYNEDSYRYTGYERDYDINMDYMKSRHYKYGIGRFQTPDKINGKVEELLTWNLYSYVQDNPLNFNDPSGTMERWQGLGKAIDPYPVEYNFPLATGYISPAELSAYYSIILSIALAVENKNYEIQYAEAVNQFISLLQEQIKSKGDIYNILYDIFKKAGFGMLSKEVVTTILEINRKYIQWRTQEFYGTTQKVESAYEFIRHQYAIAIAHTHPNRPISPEPTFPKDYIAAAKFNLPNIVVSKSAIWVVMPNKQAYNVLIGLWWK